MSIEAMKLALEALETLTKEMLTLRDELAERGGRPTQGYHQLLWDSSHKVYTDTAIPAAESLRQAIEREKPDGTWGVHQQQALNRALSEQAQPVAYRSYGAMKNGLTGWRFATHKSTYHDDPNQEPLYTAPPQRKPLTDEQVNECGMCGYVGKDKDKTGQCPKCRWDELRPLTGKAHQKPLTDDQIYEMYNEPRSDAEMLEFARAIEAAHGIKGEA